MVDGLFVTSVPEWLDLQELKISELKSASQQGDIYNVKKVGFLITDDKTCQKHNITGAMTYNEDIYLPTIVTESAKGDELHRLPIELSEWVFNNVAMAHSGANVFPCKVEFGNLNERIYAEFI